MKTNIPLACDPYEGANLGYRIVNPEASTDDWERWVGEVGRCANGHFDYFAAYASVCQKALEAEPEIVSNTCRMLSYSAGYFHAMESVISSLIDILSTSSWMPHHMDRYRYNLLKFPERYVDEEADDVA